MIQAMKKSVFPRRECYAKAEFFRKPNLSEYLPNVPKCELNTRQDNRDATVIHLTRA